jgi:hypothetical protein
MNPDFRDLLSAFSACAVEYLVVGAHALAVHGHVRATKDLDVWVRPTRENATRVLDGLAAFGAPLHDLSLEDLSRPGLVFQIGVPPVRIDVVTGIDGVEFGPAWLDRLEAKLDGLVIPVLSRKDLIRNKRATGRLQDLADVEQLEKLERDRPEEEGRK